MANSLLSPDSDQDEALNRGQQHYNERLAQISAAENEGSPNESGQENNDSPWNSTYGSQQGNEKSRSILTVKNLKKASPLLGIGGGLGIVGLLFTFLTAPSLLFVQMKEIMVDRFNTQLSAYEARTNKLLMTKIDNSTTGFCHSKVTIRCKFKSLPDRHLKKLKNAGFEFQNEQKTLGRTKFSAYIFDGQEISAQDFQRKVYSDPKLRSALRQAYNPKFASFRGEGWKRVASKFKIRKTAPTLDVASDPEGAQNKLNQIGKEGVEADTRVRAACSGDGCTWSESDEEQTRAKTTEIDQAGKSGEAASEVNKALRGLSSGPVTGALKVTGLVDNACLVYGAINTLSFAVKTIRNAQMVRFAMVFLTTADAIKAGESPDSKDIEFLGNNLTATIRDPNDSSKTLVASATDSLGYKYAAYGDATASKQSTDIANRFMAGGGFSGELAAMTTGALSMIGGDRKSANSTCGVLANPFVQAGSLVAGVAMLFVPGVNVGRAVAGAVAGAAAVAAVAILPSLLADTLAGTVTDDIVGEESGNAIASGSGALMSSLATSNGVGYMSKDQALAYNEELTDIKNDYIAMERAEKSPFDPSSPHTFTGSIVSNLLPVVHSANNNPITIVGSLLSTSFRNLIPQASALSKEQYTKVLNSCSDIDLADVEVATDPFCNTINGIPSKYTGKDPMAVIDELGDQLSDEGRPQGAYRHFVDKCIETDNPFGYVDSDNGMTFDPDLAKECIINDNNANYYLNYVDMRIEEGMTDGGSEGEDEPTEDWVHPLGDPHQWASYSDGGGGHDRGAIDFAMPSGTPILAVTDGTVSLNDHEVNGFGNFITIEHTDGTASVYAHLVSPSPLKKGDAVTAGQEIGKVGSTGNSTGPHLHFEIRKSAPWGEVTPAYAFMREKGVDLGPCSAMCHLGGK